MSRVFESNRDYVFRLECSPEKYEGLNRKIVENDYEVLLEGRNFVNNWVITYVYIPDGLGADGDISDLYSNLDFANNPFLLNVIE